MIDLLLRENSCMLVFDSVKFIISKNKKFIEYRYLSDDDFKMNVMMIVNMKEKKIITIISLLFNCLSQVTYDLKLGHVNNFIQKIINLDLSPIMIFYKNK